MTDQSTSISKAFQVFMASTPARTGVGWGGPGLGSADALDDKTAALAYLAVLAALRIESGVPFHVRQAKQWARPVTGSSRDPGGPAGGRSRCDASPAGHDCRL